MSWSWSHIVAVFENLPLLFLLTLHSFPTPQGRFSFRKKTAKKTTMTPSSAPVEIHPDSVAVEVAMAKTEVETDVEVPSVAPSDSDSYTNSLIDDESWETEDQTFQEWSIFGLTLTLKSAKNCNVDTESEKVSEIGDEWLDFVDKKIMRNCPDAYRLFLSVDESTAVSTAVSTDVSTKCESKTFEDEETLSKKYPKELVPFISCLLTLAEDKAKKTAKQSLHKTAELSLHDVDDEMQRASLIQEYIQKLMMHKDMSLVPPELMPLVQKFEALNGAATDTIFPVVAAE